MASKEIMNDALHYERAIYNDYFMYFLGLLDDVVTLENLPDDVPKRYFLHTLFKYGKIGFGNGLYLPVSGVGVDLYGLPTEYVFTAKNGITFTKSAKDCVILRCNDQSYPVYPYIRLKCQQLANIETSIYQNLFAVRTQAVYECRDNATLLSLKNAYKSRRLGAEVLFQTGAMAGETNLTVHNTGAEYLCEQLNDLKKEVFDEILTRFGIMTANTNKRERVQSSEVYAGVGEAYDNVYVMIDTFNYDARVGGLDVRMKLNTSIEDYYKALQSDAGEGGIGNGTESSIE